jgi:heptosyltransferase I
MSLFDAPPTSICILRLSAIGDVCHTIAAVQQIQQYWPQCKITWITGKIESQLIHDLPGIEVIVFDKSQGMKGMRQVWSRLSGQRFDALLHMQLALRASLLSAGIKAKYRVGYSWRRAKEAQWLFTNRKLPDSISYHVLDNLADFVRFIGVPFTMPSWTIPVTEADVTFAQQYISVPSLIICPAASKDERNWLPERYAAVADHAVRKGIKVVLCGSPTEREQRLGKQIEQFCQHDVVNLIGQTSLKQLVALINQAQVVIAPDSGPAHIATTQNTPVIGLYAHSNPKRTGPYLSQPWVVSVYESLVLQQYGKPAEELKWGTRIKGKGHMSLIGTQSVIDMLDRVLAQHTN